MSYYKNLSDAYALLLRENEHLRDALEFYATDETDDGWVAIHALEFAGADRYIFETEQTEGEQK